MSEFQFKIATEESEFEQIHRLNYRTFVKEIPQHYDNHSGKLIDKFHEENTYIICLNDDRLYGMVALRAIRPFSLDAKLDNLDAHLPPNNSPCEIRLLAIEKNHRQGKIVAGLFSRIAEYCELHRHDIVLISGTVRQLKLYHHIGFKDFGPLVGSGDAVYQPMYRMVEAFQRFAASTRSLATTSPKLAPQISHSNFMPGPVKLSSQVMQALQAEPVSHRSTGFMSDLQDTTAFLKSMFNCSEVTILSGSGTLANDVVAAQISALNTPGLILVNGEFGHRLEQHANHIGLQYSSLEVEEGQTFSSNAIDNALAQNPAISWLWCTHCETSTGVLNDLTQISTICAKHNVKLCVDCISSIGTLPVDLSQVFLAAGVSGKGLGSIPGLGLIFYNHRHQFSTTPTFRYMDLNNYHQSNGVPYTLSSNLFYALTAALRCKDWPAHFSQLELWSRHIRQRLQNNGYQVIARESLSSPAVFTIQLPPHISSINFGDTLETRGIQLSYMSDYLLKQNRVQICLMGDLKDEDINHLLGEIENMDVMENMDLMEIEPA